MDNTVFIKDIIIYISNPGTSSKFEFSIDTSTSMVRTLRAVVHAHRIHVRFAFIGNKVGVPMVFLQLCFRTDPADFLRRTIREQHCHRDINRE